MLAQGYKFMGFQTAIREDADSRAVVLLLNPDDPGSCVVEFQERARNTGQWRHAGVFWTGNPSVHSDQAQWMIRTLVEATRYACRLTSVTARST